MYKDEDRKCTHKHDKKCMATTRTKFIVEFLDEDKEFDTAKEARAWESAAKEADRVAVREMKRAMAGFLRTVTFNGVRLSLADKKEIWYTAIDEAMND